MTLHFGLVVPPFSPLIAMSISFGFGVTLRSKGHAEVEGERRRESVKICQKEIREYGEETMQRIVLGSSRERERRRETVTQTKRGCAVQARLGGMLEGPARLARG